ncbi:hypothetical protein N7450_011685 [Penicillium hetheringtonii]|uniref:Uncharacterized protein n=1 Tax=Penicillium hetheringtonii TaxID=911720 RepID=A0AAD6DAC9_9EURO|nr:hypothetical protein N7450_011685 [Penicillium hetheringtonii]
MAGGCERDTYPCVSDSVTANSTVSPASQTGSGPRSDSLVTPPEGPSSKAHHSNITVLASLNPDIYFIYPKAEIIRRRMANFGIASSYLASTQEELPGMAGYPENMEMSPDRFRTALILQKIRHSLYPFMIGVKVH